MITSQQVSRILDANANRAREGLRTAEDYARFLLGDLRHAEQLRGLRQSLTEVAKATPGMSEEGVAARNVAGDPFEPEHWKDVLRRVERETPLDVAQRGLKRAQEALRVLEEFTRGEAPQSAEIFAKLRYSVYDVEQWLVCASPSMQIVQSARVYVLLTATLCRNCNVFATSEAVLKGGVKLIQLREKHGNDVQLLHDLRRLNSLCRDYGALVCCNDRLDLALLAGCHMVHFGQGDLTPEDARKIAGQRLIIGRSTHSVEQAQCAINVESAHYIAIGSMFETRTKAEPILAGLKLAEQVAALKLSTPVFAIGGITFDRLGALKSAGVKRVAVSQAIIGSADPEGEARKFVEAMATIS
ncbi:MAG TPA: thiamine phosphate synthase [Planctomycetota bacterium]|nr:thiamine phosphate synthase [Planctomycetota bacterium]